MAPRKNKKKTSLAFKSTPEPVVTGKKKLKKGGKTCLAADESISREVVSDQKKVEDEKLEDAKESVPTPVVRRKPCTWLKLDRLNPPIGNKSSPQSCKQRNEAKPSTRFQAINDNERKRNENGEERLFGNKSSLHSCKQGNKARPGTQVQAINDNKRKRKENGEERVSNSDPNFNKKIIDPSPEKKEKGIADDTHESTKKREEDEESDKNSLGGLIFMCNAKTKPDCFGYQLMGVPINKKEVVMGIKPGLILFLYDYDLKLLYGVFEASSPGGMKLEPAAFGGGFPAQVRFTVHKDFPPLPESVFKKAIKDSYDEKKRKFKTELTVKQVQNLINLFCTAPRSHPNSEPLVQERNPILSSDEFLTRQRYLDNYGPTDPGGYPRRDPLFLTEQEYRNSGLRQGEPNKLDRELKHLLRNRASTSADPSLQLKREVNKNDPFFLGEKEYRAFGLRGPQQMPNANEIITDTGNNNAYDPYDEATTSLVNRYLGLPGTAAIPTPYTPTPYVPTSYINNLDRMKTHPRMVPDGERAFANYNLHEQSDVNQRAYLLNASRDREPSVFDRGNCFQGENDLTPAPVSRLYSFGGSQHR